MKKIQLTKEGFEKLQKEYQDLKENKRSLAVERLRKARAMGDLSENSEYAAAKEGLAFVEERIQEIEAILKNVEIVENHTDGQEVSLGAKVTVEVNNHQESFQVVGEFEADPTKRKLSSTSPIGSALLGKKVGDTVEVKIPAGKVNYKIVDIK